MKPALIAVAVLVLACPGEGKPPTPPVAPVVAPPPAQPPKPVVTDITAEDYPMPRLPRAKVTLVDTAGRKLPIESEVAFTRDSRTRGLMWRYNLAERSGMLFIFTREQPLSFWMRNTLIPLDMIFIDAKGKIVSIVENAEPRTLSSRPSAAPATYVLEVPGGYCAKSGVKAGSSVSFEGISTLVAED